MTVSDGVRALEEGRAFVVLSGWRAVAAVGAEAIPWLNDLVTNRVDDIGTSELRRTLFLDRTGHIGADVHVLDAVEQDGSPGGALIFQDPIQPFPIENLLSPYVLSADVVLEDRSEVLGLIPHGGSSGVQFMAWPGPGDRMGCAPVETGELETTLGVLRSTPKLTEATAQDAEAYRIRRGAPRFGVDFSEDALPAEVGWESLVDTTKGCFLGQESVAKVRNLGHPPRLVLAFEAEGSVYPMAPITAAGEEVGRVTSVAPLGEGEGAGEGTACIGWVRWEARDAELAVDRGLTLTPRRVR
jgi:folate-binding protein YgfZ